MAFAVAGAYIWNGLPADVTSAPSLPVVRQRLKTVLFHRSYPNMCVIWTLFSLSDSGPSSIFSYLGHFKKFCDDDDDLQKFTKVSDYWKYPAGLPGIVQLYVLPVHCESTHVRLHVIPAV